MHKEVNTDGEACLCSVCQLVRAAESELRAWVPLRELKWGQEKGVWAEPQANCLPWHPGVYLLDITGNAECHQLMYPMRCGTSLRMIWIWKCHTIRGSAGCLLAWTASTWLQFCDNTDVTCNVAHSYFLLPETVEGLSGQAGCWFGSHCSSVLGDLIAVWEHHGEGGPEAAWLPTLVNSLHKKCTPQSHQAPRIGAG